MTVARPPGRRARGAALALAVLLGLTGSSAAVWGTTSAAFTDRTSVPGNTFRAGTVVLRDDDAGTALFTVSGMKPGDSASRCLAVTYDGDVTSDVRVLLRGADLTGTLGPSVDLLLEEGTGGGAGGCAGFSGSAVWTGTLAGFATGSPVGTWRASGPGQQRTYRVTVALRDVDAAQGAAAGFTLTWRATST